MGIFRRPGRRQFSRLSVHGRRPALSVIVVVYRMRREAPRTLYTLSPEYQRRARPDSYEVVVVENPSDQMLSADEVTSLGVKELRTPEDVDAAMKGDGAKGTTLVFVNSVCGCAAGKARSA